MVKCGKFTVQSTPFSITGLGFQPRWIIFLFSNFSVEDVWTSGPSAGISWSSMRNSVTDPSGIPAALRTSQISEIWAGNGVAGSFLGNVTTWIRSNRGGGNGWALVIDGHDADGFSLRFSPGFAAGAGGQTAYYLAGDNEYEQVGATAPWVQGATFYDLGWEPLAWFGLGAGGNVGPFGGNQSFTLADRSVPSACFGDWGEYTPGSELNQSAMWRSILDPNVNIQHYYGFEDNFSPITIIEPQDAGGAAFSDTFDVTKTDTSFKGQIHQVAGFSDGDARMHTIILGNVDSIIGSFTPSPTVGVPTEITLPFTPQAVVFFSPQDYHVGVGDPATQGATGWGFCTEDDQALLIYGGYWNPPNPFQSAGLISSQNCWVSNCKDTPQAVGSNVAMGSARVTPAGFEHTTTENDAPALYKVLYWAFAPKKGGGGFFRVVNR